MAGIAIFFGEMVVVKSQGGKFTNLNTGEVMEYTMLMHVRYFMLNQEKHLSIVIIICIVMFFCLLGFFGYHLYLAKINQTTNESFKVSFFEKQLDREEKILNAILKECEEWTPETADDLMPKIAVDEISMPRTKPARIQKLKEMI